jgi:hypothetical protein
MGKNSHNPGFQVNTLSVCFINILYTKHDLKEGVFQHKTSVTSFSKNETKPLVFGWSGDSNCILYSLNNNFFFAVMMSGR